MSLQDIVIWFWTSPAGLLMLMSLLVLVIVQALKAGE